MRGRGRRQSAHLWLIARVDARWVASIICVAIMLVLSSMVRLAVDAKEQAASARLHAEAREQRNSVMLSLSAITVRFNRHKLLME